MMRVKVGHTWHEATPGAPVMVELTQEDRIHIADMAPDATRYAIFADDEGVYPTREAKLAWMDEGQ